MEIKKEQSMQANNNLLFTDKDGTKVPSIQTDLETWLGRFRPIFSRSSAGSAQMSSSKCSGTGPYKESGRIHFPGKDDLRALLSLSHPPLRVEACQAGEETTTGQSAGHISPRRPAAVPSLFLVAIGNVRQHAELPVPSNTELERG